MKSLVKTLLAVGLVLVAATAASAQAAGNWQKVHGQIQAVQGNHLTVKADDGRILRVDASQVSDTVRAALTPGLGVTITGFPDAANRMTARYIEQDNAGAASASVASTEPTQVITRVLPLVPQFVNSQELRDHTAGFRRNRHAAAGFVTQLYRGFFERDPSDSEQNYWVDYLTRSGDVQGTVEGFMKSTEYVARNKHERQVIIDLYQSVFGRTPSPDEVRNWQHQIAQR